MKLLRHGMKIVEKNLKERLRSILELKEMQFGFGFMPGKGTMNILFVVRLQEYLQKDKSCICVLYIWRRPSTKFQGRWRSGHYK